MHLNYGLYLQNIIHSLLCYLPQNITCILIDNKFKNYIDSSDFLFRSHFLKPEMYGSKLRSSLRMRSVFVTTRDIFIMLSGLNC